MKLASANPGEYFVSSILRTRQVVTSVVTSARCPSPKTLRGYKSRPVTMLQARPHCPYRKFCAEPHEGCHSPQPDRKPPSSLRPLPIQSGERNPPMHACAREYSSNTKSNGPRRESWRWRLVESGFFRQPVVRSGGAAHRPAAPPDRAHFRRLNRSWLRRVLPQRKMCSRSVIVIEI